MQPMIVRRTVFLGLGMVAASLTRRTHTARSGASMLQPAGFADRGRSASHMWAERVTFPPARRESGPPGDPFNPAPRD